MVKAFLQKKISPRVANGHPWIYVNEIDKIEGVVAPGDIVEVYTHDESM
jgi:23S rRNA (cytosine1962-C5)-methyltransferase